MPWSMPSCFRRLEKAIKRKTEELKKKHAMEYAKLLQEIEEGMQRDLESENETNGVEEKDQGLKIKIEEIFSIR